MSMELGSATIGTNTAEVKQITNNIKTNLIQAAKDQADTNLDALVDDVPNHWVGATADQFVEKVKKDKETFKKIMDEIYDRMEEDIKQMSENVVNADAQVGQHMKEANK